MADVLHRPITGSGTRLTSGLLHDWQRRSSQVSLPLAVSQMEVAGNIGNLRLAASGGDSGYRGPAFMDSDVYKTLEAIAWELGRSASTGAADANPVAGTVPVADANPVAGGGPAAGTGPAAAGTGPAGGTGAVPGPSPVTGASAVADPSAGAGDSLTAFAAFAAEATTLLEKAQQPDGYLNSHVQVTGKPRYAQLASSHELYCAGHLIQAAIAAQRAAAAQAAIAAQRAAGAERDAAERDAAAQRAAADDPAAGYAATAAGLLSVARRFADHLVDTFTGTTQNDGHPIIETALTELYRETGHEPYLRLASQFVEQRGRGLIGDSGFGSRYLQDHLPVRKSAAEVGHVVRALYLEAGIADVAAETGDRELLAASAARWDDMVATKTAITGGNGSRHSGEAFGDAFELPPDRAYNETCAAIASFQWSWRLLLATGEAKYADLMERLLYNGFGAAVSADGRRFFYVNPLQRRVDHVEDDHPGRRREWFSCACCPPNIMRLLASLQHYLATVSGDVLYLHQFTESSIAARLPAGPVELAVRTRYPWAGRVSLQVRSAPAGECGLAVRVPAWSPDARLLLGGQPLPQQADGRGYLIARRHWQPGDVLTFDLDVSPRLSYPSRRIDALRGCAAVERGPLVYCFEQADQPDQAGVEDLAITPPQLADRAIELPGLAETVAVTVAATRLPPARGLPYAAEPDRSAAAGEPATAVAIPYFQWDNRDGAAMRVWLPVTSPDALAADTPTTPGGDPEPDRVPRPRRIA